MPDKQPKDIAITKEQEDQIDDLILDNIDEGVFLIDKQHRIIMFNSMAADISEFSAEEVLGKKYREVLHFVYENGGIVNDGFIAKAIKTGNVQRAEGHTELIRKDGERIPVINDAVPLKDKNGVLIIFRDVSRKRNIEKAQTGFITLVSHKMRTPLSGINWYAEMLLDGDAGKISEEQKDFINEIYKSNKRMAKLVDEFLNVSYIELGTFVVEPQPIDFKKIVGGIIEEFEPDMKEKEIEIKETYEKNALFISADPKLVRIICQNLLSNAVKYTPERGAVHIEMSKKGDSILIKVSDNGYGIPEYQHLRVFSKLFRGENIRGKGVDGTGLGLYIVKAIVQEVGGKIWFESEENKGTIFYVSLPLSWVKKGEEIKQLK